MSSNKGTMHRNLSMVDLHSLREGSETFSVAPENGSQHKGSQNERHRLVSPSGLPDPGDTTLRTKKKQTRQHALTEHERKMRRILSNRRSAKASRDSRRRLLLADLSTKVENMSTEHASLSKTNNTELRAQTRHLRMRLQFALESLETHQAASAAAPPNLCTTPCTWFPQSRFLLQEQQQERLSPLPFQCQPSDWFHS